MLEKVNYPQDIKSLSYTQLSILAEDIRKLIINVVSKRGGHLASSLGAVELCIALHYVLNTPKDTLIFDVGHQTYAHKILTGRKDNFASLRTYQGLSGFPNYFESEYDLYISGHASTAVSWGLGIAKAKKLEKDNSHTVVVVGDGSLTGGMCFEALNQCGHDQDNLLVILNHNQMSISRSVGALSTYLTKLISLPIYNKFKNELESLVRKLSLPKPVKDGLKRFEEGLKGLIVPGIFFEELGFRYFGPIDGHNLEVLIPNLENILSLSGPRVLHIITKKGKGYKFAEENAEEFHGTPLFEVDTGSFLSSGKRSFSQVFAQALIKEAEADKKIVAITAAMIKGTGLEEFNKKFPNRLFDVGIAEEHAVGLASGLAKKGFKPVVAIYSTFLQRAFDQIIHDVALQNIRVIFCLDRAGFVGEDGPTHHGIFDICYMRMIPNIIVMEPKDAEELEAMLHFALQQKVSCSIRYPRSEAISLSVHSQISLGKSEILRQGEDGTIFALGSMVNNALQAADILAKKGVELTVINSRFVVPLDEQEIIRQYNKNKNIFTVEEGILDGGFGSAVAECLIRNQCFQARIFSFGIPKEFPPAAKRSELLEMYKLAPSALAERIIEKINIHRDKKIKKGVGLWLKKNLR